MLHNAISCGIIVNNYQEREFSDNQGWTDPRGAL